MHPLYKFDRTPKAAIAKMLELLEAEHAAVQSQLERLDADTDTSAHYMEMSALAEQEKFLGGAICDLQDFLEWR